LAISIQIPLNGILADVLTENKLSSPNPVQAQVRAQFSISTDDTQRNRMHTSSFKYSIQWNKRDLYIIHWNLTLTLWNLAS